jgi:hypothetical protein
MTEAKAVETTGSRFVRGTAPQWVEKKRLEGILFAIAQGKSLGRFQPK